MFKRMGHVAIQVKDLQKTLQFYRDVLGLKSLWESPDWANLGLGGDDLSLVLEEGAKHPPHVGFFVDQLEDLKDARQKLLAQGVKCGAITEHRDTTHSFYFTDPEGNILEGLWDPRVNV